MKFNSSIRLIFKAYILLLALFSVFRLLLLYTQFEKVESQEAGWSTIAQALLMGLRFDLVISGYLLALPAVLLLLFEGFHFPRQQLKRFLYVFLVTSATLCFIVCAADIPYFGQFFERFSIGAFAWADSPQFVASMILNEPQYYLMFLPLIGVLFIWIKGLRRIFSAPEAPQVHTIWFILSSVVFLGLMFLGIRGRIEQKSPIKVGTAYFSEYAVLNKLGLNPVFTLIRSTLDARDPANQVVQLMEKAEAERLVKQTLPLSLPVSGSPVARSENTGVSPVLNPPNIVIVLMESMSAAKMSYFGNEQKLTPFLDSLARESAFFDRCYSAGKHTYNGVFSTLHAFPALYRQHSMKTIRTYDGMASVLKQLEYSTYYFTTHDGQFDNVEGFLRANAFEEVISVSSYPLSDVKTTLGVPDDVMFRRAVPLFNTLAQRDKPFFATLMTTSDHTPFYIPEYFHPRSSVREEQIVEYADWSLRQFFEQCKEQSWFENTLFVFLADHGVPIQAKYDIPLNYFHIPLIIHGERYIPRPKVYSQISSQIDVFPTVLGILKQPYINNTLGIDLFSQQRPFALLNDDNKIGVIDTQYLCVMRERDEEHLLYDLSQNDKRNLAKDSLDILHEMTNYAKSQMQVYQDMILSGSIHLDTVLVE